MKGVAYLAGPMSGHALFNFPSFDEARDTLIKEGWQIISPADLDRAVGFDPATDTPDKKFLDEAMKRDFEAIMRVDAMIMLPGWQNSTGARAEYWLARWRHIPVYCLCPDFGLRGVPDDELKAFHHQFTGSEVLGGVDPKKSAGDEKCPMWLNPPVAEEHTAWVHGLGAKKYGPYNWRTTGVSLSTYISAIKRHLSGIAKGEWLDPESGRPHAAHIAASCNILMDADAHNKLDHGQ